MTASRGHIVGCTLLLLASWIPANAQPPRSIANPLVDRAAAAGGVVTSVSDDGVPQFIWAADATPGPAGATDEGAARWHLGRFAGAFNASSADLAAAATVGIQVLAQGGVIAHFRQRLGDVEVYGSDVNVLMRADRRLVAIAGRLRALSAGRPRFANPPEQALATALTDRLGVDVPASNLTPVAGPTGDRRFEVTGRSDIAMPEPAVSRPILYPTGGQLVAAYFVEFYAGAADSSDSAAYRYIVAADDGRVLDRRDLTVSEASAPGSDGPPPEFSYRVWADPADKRLLDGPQIDVSPHPTGQPDGTKPPFVPPNLVTTGGLNWQPSVTADPWLGGDATETVGNNADAYVDHRAPDGLTPAAGDFRADITGPRAFDRVYDTSAGPLATIDQSKAAIANAFYAVNWLHDYWYDSGFNEAAGNAQQDNYGRGGIGGDRMRVEVQDNWFGGSRNNANMSTPSDGLRPRMQMYTWLGEQTASITLTPGGTLGVGTAAFGPTNFDVTAPVALADDGVPVTTNACEPLAGYTGKIVLVDRGICTFVLKARNVQDAGGVGVIVANNAPGAPPGMGGTDPLVTIPVLSISLADGNALKAALAAGPVTARMFRQTGVERDGALDNTIVSHEWGHYLHHRLADCGAQQCGAMSEGWGDFVALHSVARDGDNLDGTYAVATYSSSAFDPNSAYFGIRRVPYSVDFTRNALTLKHISDGVALPAVPTQPGGANSEVHNAGEIWATMMWEAYVALQKAHAPDRTFDDVRRQMADYVVGGLQMAPSDATYTEQRDAILAAAAAARPDTDAADPDDLAAGGADAIVLARAFARRGAGTCAISPPRNSTNLVGVTESYEVRPRIALGEIRIDEGRSCDRDGYIDAGETGRIVVPVMNGGPAEMLDTVVAIASSTPGVSFPRGSSVRIARLAPFSKVEVAVDIAVDASLIGAGQLAVTATVSNAQACEAAVTAGAHAWINVDNVPNSSTVDRVESATSPWTATGANAGDIWSRVEIAPFDRAWLGVDFGAISDTQLTSPDLRVSATDAFVVTFDHRFSFETSNATFWDGGVLEVSRDGGPWEDVSMYVAPGYGGTLFTGAGNPLAGRSAFVGQNASWPQRDTLSLNFGTAFAGQTVRIRFRIGTDEAVGDYGWEIDNISVQGITNTPFSTLVADQSVCRATK